jgi:hypothetical protein
MKTVQHKRATAAIIAAGDIALTDTQTAALPAGTYGWQLDGTAPASIQRTALSLTVKVYA